MKRSSSAMLALVVMTGACAPRSTVKRIPRAVLWFGGDVHFGERATSLVEGLTLDGPLVVNLEGPIGTVRGPSTRERLVNPPEAPQRLATAGVVAAGVDNNHALDDGPAGLERTRQALLEARVVPLGLSVLTVSGVPVTLLQVDLSKGAPPDLDRRLDWAVQAPGVAVVLFHVLAVLLYTPDPPLQAAVDAAVQAGVDAVLVHGSHVVGAVQRRGASVVAWGLGNLVFDCDCTTEDEGLLIRLEVTPDHVERATAVPIRAGLKGAPAHRPPPEAARQDLDLLEALGSALVTRRDDSADF